MKKQPTARRGFTLVEIMVVIGIIGLLMAAAMPNFIKAIGDAKRRICLVNVANIEGAKAQWALNETKSDNDEPKPDDLRVYLKDNTFPSCPCHGIYEIHPVDAKPACSIHGATPSGP